MLRRAATEIKIAENIVVELRHDNASSSKTLRCYDLCSRNTSGIFRNADEMKRRYEMNLMNNYEMLFQYNTIRYRDADISFYVSKVYMCYKDYHKYHMRIENYAVT